MSKVVVKNYKGVEVKRVKNASSAENAEMRMKNAIIDEILKVNNIIVPQDLVDNEVTMMVGELRHKLKYKSLEPGGYLDVLPDDMVHRMEKFREEAVKLVKTRMVLKGIIAAENFEVTKEDLEKEAKAISVRQQMSIKMVKYFLGEDLEMLRDDLLLRKAIDFVYANAVIK